MSLPVRPPITVTFCCPTSSLFCRPLPQRESCTHDTDAGSVGGTPVSPPRCNLHHRRHRQRMFLGPSSGGVASEIVARPHGWGRRCTLAHRWPKVMVAVSSTPAPPHRCCKRARAWRFWKGGFVKVTLVSSDVFLNAQVRPARLSAAEPAFRWATCRNQPTSGGTMPLCEHGRAVLGFIPAPPRTPPLYTCSSQIASSTTVVTATF